MDETTIPHAINSNEFPQLRIMAGGNRVNFKNKRFVSIGVMDSLGNTEWTDVTWDALWDALLDVGGLTFLGERIATLKARQ